MVEISNKKWKQIVYIFDNWIDADFYICPECGMPIKDGYICFTCGHDLAEDNIDYEKFELI